MFAYYTLNKTPIRKVNGGTKIYGTQLAGIHATLKGYRGMSKEQEKITKKIERAKSLWGTTNPYGVLIAIQHGLNPYRLTVYELATSEPWARINIHIGPDKYVTEVGKLIRNKDERWTFTPNNPLVFYAKQHWEKENKKNLRKLMKIKVDLS